MTASQNTDLFVLGLVPRGVVFAGEAMCVLKRSMAFLAVVRSTEWVLSPFARGEHGRTVHSSACAMHGASKKASRQAAFRQIVCQSRHRVVFQWRLGKADSILFSARYLLHASAPSDGHAMSLIRIGGTKLIHTL